MRALAAACAALVLSSCASLVSQRLSPDVFYKRDMRMKINGKDYVGVAVPPRADSYEIEIETVGDINMLTVTSCHREQVFEEPTKGWFKAGNKFKYSYRPVKGVEDGRGCLLDIGSYERNKGRHQWASVDFVTMTETVPATLTCDGEVRQAGPVSICQAKAGLVQRIRFDRPMRVSPDEGCKVMATADEFVYEYEMPRSECTFYFGDKDGNFHRLTTLGYESIFVRDVKE
jgi:hypothetical protein